ncbi:MAG: Fic family protein [Wenzhouxiangella sp.]|nr:Fic family protein [Wenzhouxiangella sp.]
MDRGLTGSYSETTAAGETVRAFVPSPLPPEPPLDIDPQRQQRLERALLACGRLDAITALLPDPDLFLYSYVRREAVLSSQIEGTQSSLSDLLLFELDEQPGVPFDDVVEVSNYIAAMEHGLKRLREGFPLSNRLLREIHARLLARGRGADKQPGEFRRSQNWIGGTRPGNAQYVPPPPNQVEDCMAALERFLHAPEAPGTLVKAALAHVQFETIHPFLDGNGRVGRLLIALILHHDGVLREPLLYLSLYFKQHRAEYYRLLDSIRHTGNWEIWLDFVLEGIEQTATSAVDTAHRLLALFSADAERIETLGRAAPNALRVFDALRRRPLARIDGLANQVGIAFPTAARAIQSLQGLGIVTEITGRKRERVFAYRAYLDILNEGAQPL